MFPLNPLSLEVAVLVLGLLLLLIEMFVVNGRKTTLAWAGIAGLSTVFLLSFAASSPQAVDAFSATGDPLNYRAFYSGDSLAMFFKRFALLTTIVVLVMSVDYLGVIRKFTPGATAEGGLGEFLALPVFTCAGLMWMASATDFCMIFVSLELVTISFYVLVSYTRRNAASLEAGVKYLILGALSTGFFVYGITWIYGVTGETSLARVGAALLQYKGGTAPVMFSFILLTIALGFKIAAVPFQIWVPDVYQGAPTPVTAFLSVGSKAAGFVVFMRIVNTFAVVPVIAQKMTVLLVVMAVATLIYGNLAALPQNNLKRLLAYSSIGHAGYLLMAIASGVASMRSGHAVLFPTSGVVAFYLASYLPMTLLCFLVMIVVANYSAGDDVADFSGLSKRSPLLAFAMLIAMLSLAGIPFTGGFNGKFFVFLAAFNQRQYLLVAVGSLAVACGFYYYLKVVKAMYFQPVAEEAAVAVSRIPISNVTRVAVVLLVTAIVWLGVNPGPALGLFGEPVRPAGAMVRTAH